MEKTKVIITDVTSGENFYLNLTKEQIALFHFFDTQNWVNDLELKIIDDIDFEEINNF
jgi:hypothetical protein